MSRFYGRVGPGMAKTEGTRRGSPKSGMKAKANGWNIGGMAVIGDVDNNDEVALFITGGSNERFYAKKIVEARIPPGEFGHIEISIIHPKSKKKTTYKVQVM